MAAQLPISAGVPTTDLSSQQEVAFDHGHDADFPTEAAANTTATSPSPNANAAAVSHSDDTSSQGERTTSISEKDVTDLEKTGGIITSTSSTSSADPNIIDWDGPSDPENPLNWPPLTKTSNLVLLSIMTLITPLASSMFAPGVPELMQDFQSDSTLLATFVVSVYVLGFAFGPLIIAPLSELYGRVVVYHACNLGFLAWTVACAYAPSLGALIGFRFLAGCWGVAPLTIGGGTIVDLVPQERRGAIMSAWSLGPLLGPVIGPIAGGFVAESIGWRWIFKILAIASGLVTFAAFFILRETYAPTILARKTARLRRETGNESLRSKMDSGLKPGALFARSIVRPTKMLFFAPICTLTSVFMAIIYGFLYLLFTTFTYVFEEKYHIPTNLIGLTYIGIGVGFLTGLGIMAFTSDKLLKSLAAKNGGVMKPEFRLPPLVFASSAIPIAFFIYGWTTQYQVQWAVPLLGTLILGIGMNITFMALCTYLVDTYTIYAASAMAANTVLRSLFGGVIPLFGLQLYNRLGLGWGNSLLAFISLALAPISWLLLKYGERIRTNPRFQVKL